MRKTLISLALCATFTSSLVFANQTTLDAIISTGIALSPEQILLLQETQGNPDAIMNALSAVLPQACSDPDLTQSFITAVVSANPELSDNIFEMAATGCPDMIASIAEGILQADAPAAGIESDGNTGTGLGTATGAQALGPAGAPRTPTAGGDPASPS